MNPNQFFAGTACLLLAAIIEAPESSAQTCGGMQDLGTLGGANSQASAVSANGDTVVGFAEISAPGAALTAFRWSAASGLQSLGTLGPSIARGVSSDGSIVVGWSLDHAGVARAFRWATVTGIQQIDVTPGISSYAEGISGDGATIVGAWGVSAFRWTVAGGLQPLVSLGGAAIAHAASLDGGVIVGKYTNGAGHERAFRWTEATGMQDLGTFGGNESSASGVSSDGSVVVGHALTPSGGVRAFRWTAATGLHDLGTLGGQEAKAWGLSLDGQAVVGAALDVSGAWVAFRWTPSGGMQSIGTLGGSLSGAFGASSDGAVVVGHSRNGSGETRAFRIELGQLGASYCANAIANSTGCPGVVDARGDSKVALNSLTLVGRGLPANAFGFFLTSRAQGDTFPVNNSQGRLCLGGFIGRYVGPGQILNSGVAGSFALAIDLARMPQPFGNVAAQPGETWNFQAWYRDANPGPTSNFTDAVSITFN